jgi:hypothetical protein
MGRGQRTLFVVLLLAAVVAVLGLLGVIEGLPFLGGGASSGGSASDGTLLSEEDATPAGDDGTGASRLAASPLAERPGAPVRRGRAPRPRRGPPRRQRRSASTGVVLTADRRPASHARVQASTRTAPVSALTDAEGRFHLDLAAGRYDLVLRAGRDGPPSCAGSSWTVTRCRRRSSSPAPPPSR